MTPVGHFRLTEGLLGIEAGVMAEGFTKKTLASGSAVPPTYRHQELKYH